jgi:hypothetical protein
MWAQHQAGLEGCNDARTGMPPGIPRGAMCVQRFDDSLNSAIHITYRISLRSSSMPEPRDPLLKVLTIISRSDDTDEQGFEGLRRARKAPQGGGSPKQQGKNTHGGEVGPGGRELGNDPSAGSPTETLLRLLLPLNDQVWITFRPWVGVATLPRAVRKPH